MEWLGWLLRFLTGAGTGRRVDFESVTKAWRDLASDAAQNLKECRVAQDVLVKRVRKVEEREEECRSLLSGTRIDLASAQGHAVLLQRRIEVLEKR